MIKYQYKVKGADYVVEIVEVVGKMAQVNVNGIPFEVELQKPINTAKHPSMARPRSKSVFPSATSAPEAPAAPMASAAKPASAGAGTALKAPLPGTITDVKVTVGQHVNVGDTVVILEAMKMQNNIEAEYAGTVTSIVVKQGDTVMEGAVLLTIG
ncbi:MAG: biotin/lipoyl-binding protein [Prevotella sp.]|nr:biotin/lipoyl-binding protein [Prevotella sp.]